MRARPATGAACEPRRATPRPRSAAPGRAAAKATCARRRRCSSGWRTTTSRSSATASTACGAARGATGWCRCRARASASCARAPRASQDDRAHRRGPRASRARRSRSSSPRRTRSRRSIARPTSTTSASRPSTRRAASRASAGSSGCGRRPRTATSPSEIPVLRHKVQRVIDHFRLKPSSHDHKAVVHALETFPRDELFQATVPDLVRIVRGIVNLYERAQVRLFVRRDPFRRFYSCLVYVPRDRYNTQARKRIERLAREAFGGVAIESQVTLSESVLARLHLLVRTPPGTEPGRRRRRARAPHHRDRPHLAGPAQGRAARRARRGRGAPARPRLGRRLPGRLPGRHAVRGGGRATSRLLERLAAAPERAAHEPVPARRTSPQHKVQFKLFRRVRPIPISDVLPTIENLGLKLISERPYEVVTGVRRVLDPGLRARASARRAHRPRHRRAALQDHVRERLARRRRTTTASTGWCWRPTSTGARRWCCAPMRAGSASSACRCRRPTWKRRWRAIAAAAGHLLRLFVARFDPSLGAAERRRAEAAQRRALDRLLARVTRIDDDRILRAFLAAIDATLRTNYFRTDAAGAAEAIPRAEARPAPDRGGAAAEADVRDLRAFAARRGRAPAHGPRRARRPALVRPARGLPHRDPRPDEGAERQEHGDRAGRRQGRLRPAPPARRARRGAGRRARSATARSSARCSTSPTT